jgi:hypothetical protein
MSPMDLPKRWEYVRVKDVLDCTGSWCSAGQTVQLWGDATEHSPGYICFQFWDVAYDCARYSGAVKVEKLKP